MNTTKRLLQNHRNLNKIVQLKITTKSQPDPPCKEIQIPVPWGHLAAKWWGPTDRRPILALHGWQDNCGTFNRLIPLLNRNVGYLAVDFPGHGLSSPLPSGIYYHLNDYVPLCRYIVDHFQWKRVTFLGHSLGAVAAFYYTLLYPRTVDFLMCIDAFKPIVSHRSLETHAQQIAAFLRYVAYDLAAKRAPSYTLDEILLKISASFDSSIRLEHAFHLAERNIAPAAGEPGRYRFTRDVRLKLSDMIDAPQAEVLRAAEGVRCPVLVLKARGSIYYQDRGLFFEALNVLKGSSRDCYFEFLEGTHHLHLNTPELVAEPINRFIGKHYTED